MSKNPEDMTELEFIEACEYDLHECPPEMFKKIKSQVLAQLKEGKND